MVKDDRKMHLDEELSGSPEGFDVDVILPMAPFGNIQESVGRINNPVSWSVPGNVSERNQCILCCYCGIVRETCYKDDGGETDSNLS